MIGTSLGHYRVVETIGTGVPGGGLIGRTRLTFDGSGFAPRFSPEGAQIVHWLDRPTRPDPGSSPR